MVRRGHRRLNSITVRRPEHSVLVQSQCRFRQSLIARARLYNTTIVQLLWRQPRSLQAKLVGNAEPSIPSLVGKKHLLGDYATFAMTGTLMEPATF
jgi:hypothetical protein